MEKALKVVPDTVFFRDISKGESDSVDIWVHNYGNKPFQGRLSLSPGSPFTISNTTLPMIVPGFNSKVTVSYKAKDNSVVKSDLIISCAEGSLKIPVTAIPPCPRIMADTKKIDLGKIMINTHFKFSFKLSNIGITDGSFKITCNEESVSILTEDGPILPSKSLDILCEIAPTKVGDLNFLISIDTPGSFEKCEPIQVVVSVIQQSLVLLLDDKMVNEFHFDTIFFGQKRVITAKLENRSSSKQSFVVLPPSDTPPHSGHNSPRENNNTSNISTLDRDNSNDRIFYASPSEGMLPPYQSTVVRFVFDPPYDKSKGVNRIENEEEETDDSHQDPFTQFTSIEVVETGQTIDLELVGKAVHHSVVMSSVDFNFENTQVKQSRSLKLKIENQSKSLSTSFEIKPIAHFRFNPMKGTIKPNKNVEIDIQFIPKCLGDFELQALISFCGGLFKQRINLTGTCQNEEKTFKRVPIYESDQKARFNSMHPDPKYAYDLEQIKKNETKRAQFDAYITESGDKREQMKREKEYKAKLRKEAETYLSKTLGDYDENDIDSYIKSYKEKENEDDISLLNSGLSPPEPKVSKKNVPFHIPHPEKFGIISNRNDSKRSNNDGSRNKSNDLLDENILIKRKFKAKPTSPAETNECSRLLSPAQQLMVITSHQTLNIGKICVFSKAAKSFTIQNNLQQHIVVAMKFEFDELSESGPVSQVIPPNCVAGFDIHFCAKSAMNFNKTIHYTINGQLNYSLNICAQVLPIDVQLSRQSIDFRFSPDSNKPIIKEFVTLYNKSDAHADYSWSGLAPPFSMKNISGSIEPHKSINVEIEYHPENLPHHEMTLTLNVPGGPSKMLKCIGDVGSPKCSISKKKVEFGLIPIGIEKSTSFKVKNSGDDDAIFTIKLPKNTSELHITPLTGRVAAHDYVNFNVNFKANSAHTFDIPVSIFICGSSKLNFSVTGQSEMPNIQLSNQEFEFGKVFVGSSSSIKGTLTNLSQIPAVLFLDLTNHPEFRLEFHSDLDATPSDDQKNTISLVSDQIFITKMESNHADYLTSSTRPISTANSAIHAELSKDSDGEEDESGDKGLVYRIELAENSFISFFFVFQPVEINEHSFELPLSILNVNSSSSFNLQPIVSAEAIKAPIVMSQTFLDFGVVPLFDSENPYHHSPGKLISLRNISSEPIHWRFELSSFKEAFEIEPNNGVIQPNEMVNSTIKFFARAAIPYSTNMSLLITTHKNKEGDDYPSGLYENLIGKVQLTGFGSSVMFKPSVYEVCLPIVPLGVCSQVDISIINCGFVQSSLEIQLPVDENAFPINITFPEGNQLLYTTVELPLRISFCSNRPLSFTTPIAITDDLGNVSSFLLTCTTDNSIFTIYPFLNNSQPFEIDSPFSKEFLSNTELQSKFLMSKDYLDLKNQKWENSFSPKMVQFFIRYLNALVLSSQISTFPDDFISSNGSVLLEAINNFTGKKQQTHTPSTNSTRSTNSTPSNEKVYENSPVMKRREIFKTLLRNLQAMGALVFSIRPEFLMSRSDFMELMRIKITKQIIGMDYFNSPELSSFDQNVFNDYTSTKAFSALILPRLKIVEGLYTKLNSECWMAVILQVYKLFVMGRIDSEKSNQIPGYKDTMSQAKTILLNCSNSKELIAELNNPLSLQKSNTTIFYGSPSEQLLLRWIKIHNIKMINGPITKKINDFSSLRDSVAFYNLFKSHTPLFHTSHNTFHENPKDRTQYESNAIEFLNAIRLMKFSFIPQADEIIDGSQCILAAVAEYFIEVLPHYIPSTNIEFSTTLHQSLTKSISLSNPSKTEILYNIQYDGYNNFTIPSDSIVIGPGKTIEFPITFNASTIKPVSGRVSFIPNRPRLVNSSVTSSKASLDLSSTKQPSIPLYSAPIVVSLISNVVVNEPEKTFNIETNIYTPSSLTIPVENILNKDITMDVIIKVIKIKDENDKPIQDADDYHRQITELINNPNETNESAESDDPLQTVINFHHTFLVGSNEIRFNSPNTHENEKKDAKSIDIEFIPIELGTYRCLILFYNKDEGEFYYEVIAKSTLPLPIDVGGTKFKIEAGKQCSFPVPIELSNPNLFKAIAYSAERKSMNSDKKFKDRISKRIRDIELLFKQKFVSQTFNIIVSSPQYFEIPSNELTISKLSDNSEKGHQAQAHNDLLVTFKPIKAGDYPCKFVMISKNDIRILSIKGIGIQETKEYLIEFAATLGKPINQDIPISNNSDEPLQLKISLSGDNSFTAPNRMSVKPKSTGTISVAFNPNKIGSFTGEMTVFNVGKESTVIYKLMATVDEPPSEGKIVFECKAREQEVKSFEINPFIRNGVCNITTTVPFAHLSKSEITFRDGAPAKCEISFDAPRSGITAGIITITDQNTNNYIWYVVEVQIGSPNPESTIDISTIARKPVNVSLPIENSTKSSIKYSVIISDPDLHGPAEFISPPEYTSNYSLSFTPTKEMKRTSSVHFYSDDKELWYQLNINVDPPAEQILAPVTALIGKSTSFHVVIENQTPNNSTFRIENSNPAAFQVMLRTPQVLQLPPNDKKRVEIRYIPTSIGVKENAQILFLSKENGDYKFSITGTGKPPQPLSPTIVNSTVDSENSALILFTNPFSYSCRFSVSLKSETVGLFQFLAKRNVFTLTSYGEEFQIPFKFSPHEVGQFKGFAVVSSLGPVRSALPELESPPAVQWVYPIIGNSINASANSSLLMKTKSQQPITKTLKLTLIGENDTFNVNEYKISLDVPTSMEFLHTIIDLKPEKIEKNGSIFIMEIQAKFSPMRPFTQTIHISVKNPIGQKWQFPLELISELGTPVDKIILETHLNKTLTSKIKIPFLFRTKTPFHAYFASGSASEFSLTSEHGMIEPFPSSNTTILPVEILFTPKMYGKIFKALLVVDTLDSQFLFDVVGKIPEYVPPVIKGKGKIDTTRDEEIRRTLPKKKKRNIIKENIESVKITKPRIEQKC